MGPTWTLAQIVAMAPDGASAKAGQGLAGPRQWVTAGHNESAVWGECKGSGKNPYQVQVSLDEPAFKCSCPSRKFPCKHGLGLLLLRATQPGALTESEPPQWVQEWLQGRVKRAEAQAEKVEKASRQGDAPVDAAQAKRVEKRESRIAAGVAEVELWLRDVMRRGLADLPADYKFWDTPAARMVDAQAPGLARMLRDTGAIAVAGRGHAAVLERLGRLHLLIEGWKRLAELPPAQQADVRTALGWTPDAGEVGQTGVRDLWMVAGTRIREEDRLRACRTWLWGRESHRPALVLQFAHGMTPFDTAPCGGATLVPGTIIDAELAFSPGAAPLRAVVKERFGTLQPAEAINGESISEAIGEYARAIAANPWVEAWPLALQNVALGHEGNGKRWFVRDESGELPIVSSFAGGWRLLAVSGGRTFSVCGEWNGEAFAPFAAYTSGQVLLV